MTMIKRSCALVSLGLACGLALAATVPHVQDGVQEQADDRITFKLDPVHCMANFRVQHMGAGMFWGRFNNVTGTMSTSEDGTAAPNFDVVVMVDSVDTGTEKLDRTLLGPNFFDAKEFDSITFKSRSVVSSGEGMWEVTGDLTLLGVTRPITAQVEFTGLNGNPVMKKVGYEARFSIKRSDYGMDWGVKNGALGDEVDLVVSLEGDWSA